MTWEEQVDRMRRAMLAPLPGHDAFLRFSGYPRPRIEEVLALDPPPRESAVLALLYPREDRAHTLLMRRPTYAGVHSGQVSFPGGRREPQDPDLVGTALREFLEETGAHGTAVEVLGALSPVYIPPSRSLVTPFVGIARELGPLAPDPREVAHLIEAPIERLLQPGVMKRDRQELGLPGGAREVAYFDVEGHVVWGATAMMLAELRELLLRQP